MLITSNEFKDRLEKMNVYISKIPINRFIKQNGGKKIGNKWYIDEEYLEKFLEGKTNE